MASDRDILRDLAQRWMALAQRPVMAERKRLWTALHDLRAERPMVRFDIGYLFNYVAEDELRCQDPAQRGLEKSMLWTLRQAEEVGDDIVLEPCWRVLCHVRWPDYGVPIPRTQDPETGAYQFVHPIHSPADLDKLRPRCWSVDRAATLAEVQRLQDLFGDILPVKLQGTGMIHSALTQDLYKLIGNDNLLLWLYDAPEALHRVMAYLRDDRLAYVDFLDREGLVGLNHDSTIIGSGSPGYTSDLPGADYTGRPRARNVWTWMESQETAMVSPEMFGEFFLPYMAAVANRFGLVYYGCCEPVHDRWSRIIAQIPKVRTVSISPWCDRPQMAALLGKNVVFSRKLAAAPMSGPHPDWQALEQDVDATLADARGCNMELLFRDLYQINGDRPRLRRWVEMVRSRIGGAMG